MHVIGKGSSCESKESHKPCLGLWIERRRNCDLVVTYLMGEVGKEGSGAGNENMMQLASRMTGDRVTSFLSPLEVAAIASRSGQFFYGCLNNKEGPKVPKTAIPISQPL